MNKLIELKNIVKNYNSKKKVKVLNKLSFSFNAGKIYSIMGPSGSGKSTLLNILSLIDTPTSGILKIDGRAINYSSVSSNDLLRAIGLHSRFIFSSLCLKEILSLLNSSLIDLIKLARFMVLVLS